MHARELKSNRLPTGARSSCRRRCISYQTELVGDMLLFDRQPTRSNTCIGTEKLKDTIMMTGHSLQLPMALAGF